LTSDGLVDGTFNARCQGRSIDGNAVFTGEHDLNQIIGPGQTAHVRGQKAICHGRPLVALLEYDATIAHGRV